MVNTESNLKREDTFKAKSGNTVIQVTGNGIHLTAAVFRLDSSMWHCVEEIDISFEITESEMKQMVEDYDLKEYDLDESLFSMSEGMF